MEQEGFSTAVVPFGIRVCGLREAEAIVRAFGPTHIIAIRDPDQDGLPVPDDTSVLRLNFSDLRPGAGGRESNVDGTVTRRVGSDAASRRYPGHPGVWSRGSDGWTGAEDEVPSISGRRRSVCCTQTAHSASRHRRPSRRRRPCRYQDAKCSSRFGVELQASLRPTC